MGSMNPISARVPYVSPRAFTLEDEADDAVRRLLDADVPSTIVFPEAICRGRQVYSFLHMCELTREWIEPAQLEIYKATDVKCWEIVDYASSPGTYYLGRNGNIFLYVSGLDQVPVAYEYEWLARRPEIETVIERLRLLGT